MTPPTTQEAGLGLAEGLGAIMDLSSPTVRCEHPRGNLDKVWDVAHDLLAKHAAPSPEPMQADLRETIARIVDPETFALIAHYTGIDRFDGLTPEQREPSVFQAYPELETNRRVAYTDADAILAAMQAKAEPWRRIGFNITMSPFDADTGNAVISPDEPEGPYWTLIAQGGEDEQNAIGDEIVRRLNANPSPSAPNPDLAGLVERLKNDAKGSMLRRNWRGKGGLQRDLTAAIRLLTSLK